jgi:hypothetical protein
MENLDLQQLAQLFYVLLGLILLILVILVIYVLIANRQQKAKIEQSIEEVKLAPRPALQVTGQILSLIRDDVGAPLQVEVAGTRYNSFPEIENQQVKRQIVTAAMELIQFTGVLGRDVPVPAPKGETDRWREDLRQGSKAELARIHTTAANSVPQPPPTLDQVEEQFLNLLTEMSPGNPPPEKPGLVSAIQQRWAPKLPESERPRTFVDDIEEIVQRRVQLIPALNGRDLHVRPGPGGSVCFIFEGQEYDSLDLVPNLTARQLIKDAIQEWDETT